MGHRIRRGAAHFGGSQERCVRHRLQQPLRVTAGLLCIGSLMPRILQNGLRFIFPLLFCCCMKQRKTLSVTSVSFCRVRALQGNWCCYYNGTICHFESQQEPLSFIFSLSALFLTRSLVFSLRDKVATGSFDKTCKLWSAETGKCFYTFRGHTAEIVRLHSHCIHSSLSSLNNSSPQNYNSVLIYCRSKPSSGDMSWHETH